MSFAGYLAENWSSIVFLGVQHIEAVLLSVALATVISVVLGMIISERRGLGAVLLGITGAILTVPSFALFGLLIPPLGLGLAPTICALTLYAIFPILRNTVTGLAGVPSEVVDAARGMGLSSMRRLVLVRLPLAWPVILNGVRVSTIMTVGIAAISAAVAGPGLGNLIFDGLARIGGANALNDTLAGVLGVAAVAIILDLAFLGLAGITTPKGIRG